MILKIAVIMDVAFEQVAAEELLFEQNRKDEADKRLHNNRSEEEQQVVPERQLEDLVLEQLDVVFQPDPLERIRHTVPVRKADADGADDAVINQCCRQQKQRQNIKIRLPCMLLFS